MAEIFTGPEGVEVISKRYTLNNGVEVDTLQAPDKGPVVTNVEGGTLNNPGYLGKTVTASPNGGYRVDPSERPL